MPDRRWLALALCAWAGTAEACGTDSPAFGATSLAQAVYAQNADAVAQLLAHGAKPNIPDNEGVTPLSLACELGNAPIAAQLLDAHADVRAKAADGTSALAVCARFGPTDAVGRMLAGGAAADKADEGGLTPLMWAASSGHVETMKVLLKAGANVNAVSAAGFSPLFFAIKSGVPQAAETMLAAGADTAHRGPENTSAAQLAAYQHNDAAVGMLLSHDADLTERDREGLQLLHRAAADGDAALIAALIARGADPNALTGPSKIKWVTEANFGMPPAPVPPMSPLLVAATHGQAAAMIRLVAGGADPRFIAADGTNAVLAAIAGGRADALDAALAMVPDANAANAEGMTPLHLLVLTGGKAHPGPGFAAMLTLLAQHGARADIVNKSGYTAAAMAVGGLSEVRSAFTALFPADAAKAIAAAAAKAAAEKPDTKVRT